MKNIFGFTLLELLIVIIILGILAGAGIPFYVATLERGRAKEAVDMIGAIKGAEYRWRGQTADDIFLKITDDSPSYDNASGLDIKFTARYWNFTTTLTDSNRTLNIVAKRILGSDAGEQIYLYNLTGTNTAGIWGGLHPGKPAE